MSEKKILPRGLIEVSNQCAKNCLYCGIRRGNAKVLRYHMTVDDVLACAAEALRRGYPAIALQAGELESEANTIFYETVFRRLPEVECAADVPRRLEVTLSLGEQSEAVYRRWKEAAGARVLRYLLRIETSNRVRYATIHPPECSFDRRVDCIRTLKRLGYTTGSGVMIGLPGQTKEELLKDIDFFAEMNLDMIGMGPFVAHPDTPMGVKEESPECRTARLDLALWMIAETRRRFPNANMVAATALDALAPGVGRERGIAAGANVIMPDLTPEKYKRAYDLYPGKTDAR